MASSAASAVLGSKHPGRIRDMLHGTALAGAYVVAAWLGLSVAFVHGTVSPVWPPMGLAIAALTLWGLRLWPAVAIGAFAANFIFAANPVLIAGGIAIGNTLEGVLGAVMLRRWGVQGEVTRVRDAMAILLVAILAPVLSATPGVASLILGGYTTWDRYAWIWLVWWLGNSLSGLIVLPLLLAWGGQLSAIKYPARSRELAGALALALALTSFAYLNPDALVRLDVAFLPPSAFLFPPMVWAVLRLRPRESILVLALSSASAVVYTVIGTEGETVGPLLWLQMVLFAVGGGTLLLIGALAERVQAEQALQDYQAQLSLSFQAGHSGAFRWDAEAGRCIWSEELLALYGLESFGGRLQDWMACVLPEDRGAAEAAVRQALRSGQMEHVFRIRRWDNGEVRWIHGRARILFDGSGKPRQVIGIQMDVTEQKEAEGQIQSLNAELEQRVLHRTRELEYANEALLRSNMELQHFAHAAAHDLQTPLRSIAGFAQLVQREVHGRGDQHVDEWSSQVIENTKRLQTLIQELLAYSRLDANARPLEMIELRQVGDEVQASLSALIQEREAEISFGPLPTLKADRFQMAQLLQNLVENAIKYNRSKPPRITIASRRGDGEWVVSVADNGLGIDPKHHDRIFEIFRRLHTHTEIPGTGIGLALCRRIVERHGGRIWVESQPQEGSTFCFSVPDDRGQGQ